MRLSDVLARRGSLAPPEVVTLVVGLALDLADLHASGRAHGDVCAAAVWFEPDGRPRLVPPPAPGDRAADVAALASLGLAVLGDNRPASLVDVLDAHVGDARELAERVMASGPAAPLRLPLPPVEMTGKEPRRFPRPLVVPLALLVVAPFPRPDPWGHVLAELNGARARAVADRSTAELDAVYAGGSRQLGRDAALIDAMRSHGLTLRGRLAELTDPAPLGDGTVAAVERPAAYALVDSHGRVVLRVDTQGQVRRVVVRLRQTPAGWRVVDVS